MCRTRARASLRFPSSMWRSKFRSNNYFLSRIWSTGHSAEICLFYKHHADRLFENWATSETKATGLGDRRSDGRLLIVNAEEVGALGRSARLFVFSRYSHGVPSHCLRSNEVKCCRVSEVIEIPTQEFYTTSERSAPLHP